MRSLCFGRITPAAVAVLALAVGGCGSGDVPGSVPAGGVAAQQPPPLVVSPTEGAPFTVVTVSGEGCTGPSPSVVGELEGPAGAIPGANAVFFPSVDASGGWVATFTIPPVVPPGQYRVVARCLPDRFNAQPVEYGPQPFEVLPGGSASMSVSPTQAPAGQDVLLDVSGTLCQGTATDVDVQVHPVGDEEGGEPVARTAFTPDHEGNWSGQVTIPAGPAGTNVVGAVCNVGGQQFFIYLPASPSGSIPRARLVQIGVGLPPTR